MITSVIKEVIKDDVINLLIPSIEQKLPRGTRTNIIQLYCSSDHNIDNDSDLPIIMMKNTPKIPYLNVLDLVYY